MTMPDRSRYRIAVIAPHFVQYHSPLYRTMAEDYSLDITILYLDDLGLRSADNDEFNHSPVWDISLTEGYRYKLLKNCGHGGGEGFLAKVNFGLLRELSHLNYDAVLIQGYSILSYWLAMTIAKVNGLPVIWRGEVTNKLNEFDKGAKALLKRFVRTIFLRQASAILYTCAGNKTFLTDHGISEDILYPFPCAVDNEHFQAGYANYKADYEEIRSSLGIGKGDLVVLFCGRLVPRKRPMDLFRAAARLSSDEVTLLVVGDGPLRDKLDAYAKKCGIKVIFTGFVNQSQIGRYYTISDVIALVSQYDPSPKALNEAMNFEVAIVVSDVVGTATDLVEQGRNGFIVKTGDIGAIASRLEAMLHDRRLCAAMGRSSANRVLKFNYRGDLEGLKSALVGLPNTNRSPLAAKRRSQSP